MFRTFAAYGLAAAHAASPASPVRAGALTVSPPRIELSTKRPVATLEVRNDDAQAVTVQLEKMAWTQADGDDRYTASQGLIATPAVFELAPHASQVLRVALRDPHAVGSEQAFRLYLCEVPISQQPKNSGLQMMLRIGVPVFVARPTGTLHLMGEIIRQPDGSRELLVRNAGDRFAHAIAVDLSDATGNLVWQTRNSAYVLAGGEHQWPLRDGTGLTGDAPLQVAVTTDTGVEHLDARFHP